MKCLVLSLIMLTTLTKTLSQAPNLKSFSVTKNESEYFGVKDENGKIIVPAIYAVIDIEGDRIRANTASNVLLFNSQGKLLAKYCDIQKPQYGVYRISNCSGKSMFDGLMNKDGKLILAPNKFSKIGEFNKLGLAQVEISDNDTYGIIDTLGRTIIPCKYQYINSNATNGLILFKQNNKYGYLNLKGEEVIKAKYDNAYPFKNGKAEVTIREPFRKLYIDTTGKEIGILGY